MVFVNETFFGQRVENAKVVRKRPSSAKYGRDASRGRCGQTKFAYEMCNNTFYSLP